MYQEPSHIYSSYSPNNIGQSIYNIVKSIKPKKIIDFGLLYGYSTVCLAQAVRDNGIGKIIAYDLFEDYKYKNSTKKIVEYNLQYYGLNKYVTLVKKDFDRWLEEDEDFDLLHLDISNNGDIIDNLYKKHSNKTVIFEGGIEKRDNVHWMKKYLFTPIANTKTKTNYTTLNNNFPGLSGYNINN